MKLSIQHIPLSNIQGGIFTESDSYLRAIRFYDIFQRQDSPLDKSLRIDYIEGLPVDEIISHIRPVS